MNFFKKSLASIFNQFFITQFLIKTNNIINDGCKFLVRILCDLTIIILFKFSFQILNYF